MAIVRCKNTDGKGNVTYVEYEIAEPAEEPDEEITLEDAVSEVDRLKALLEQNGISYEKGE